MIQLLGLHLCHSKILSTVSVFIVFDTGFAAKFEAKLLKVSVEWALGKP
jgi:hypothetical protein